MTVSSLPQELQDAFWEGCPLPMVGIWRDSENVDRVHVYIVTHYGEVCDIIPQGFKDTRDIVEYVTQLGEALVKLTGNVDAQCVYQKEIVDELFTI